MQFYDALDNYYNRHFGAFSFILASVSGLGKWVKLGLFKNRLITCLQTPCKTVSSRVPATPS